MPERPEDGGTATAFSTEYVAAIHGIRGALTDALSSAGARAGDPADVARRLGINKILAWRLTKIVTTTDPASPMRHFPGAKGWAILGKAFRKAGVPEDRIDAFGRSLAAYEQMIERHAGDAAMLEVMLGGRQDDPAFADHAVNLRKQAYRGAVAVWGMHARVNLAITLVAPTRGHDELLDLGFIGGMLDFQRVRESTFYPVHAGLSVSDDGTVMRHGGTARPRSSLVRRFCSTPGPEFDEVQDGDQKVFVIKPGAVGKTGMLTWVLDEVTPALVSRYRDDENELGQHGLGVRLPVELLHYDLLIHRDLSFDLPPKVMLCADIAGDYATLAALAQERLTLPMTEEIMPLGSGPPILSTPHVPRTTEMAEYLCGHVGRQLDEFTGFRFTMRYPPIPTKLFLRYPLMTR